MNWSEPESKPILNGRALTPWKYASRSSSIGWGSSVDLTQTANPLEIVWTLLMLIGTVVAAFNWWDAEGDLNLLRASKRNGVLLITALGERSDQQALFTALLCCLMLGILSLFSLPGRAPEGGPSIASTWAPALFIVTGLSLIYLSVSKKRRRKSVMEALRAHYAA